MPMPKARKRLDLKVPPLRLFDDPMGHEGHRQAGRRDAPRRSRVRRRAGTAEKEGSCDPSRRCGRRGKKCRRALPQNSLNVLTARLVRSRALRQTAEGRPSLLSTFPRAAVGTAVRRSRCGRSRERSGVGLLERVPGKLDRARRAAVALGVAAHLTREALATRRSADGHSGIAHQCERDRTARRVWWNLKRSTDLAVRQIGDGDRAGGGIAPGGGGGRRDGVGARVSRRVDACEVRRVRAGWSSRSSPLRTPRMRCRRNAREVPSFLFLLRTLTVPPQFGPVNGEVRASPLPGWIPAARRRSPQFPQPPAWGADRVAFPALPASRPSRVLRRPRPDRPASTTDAQSRKVQGTRSVPGDSVPGKR